MDLLKLKKGYVQIISPGMTEIFMTGVDHVTIKKMDRGKRIITLHYTDNSTEEAVFTLKEIKDIPNDNFFSIVGNVQSKVRLKSTNVISK